METSNADTEVKDTLIESADYNVLSRPTELIEAQKSSSSRKKFGEVFCTDEELSTEYYPIPRSQVMVAALLKPTRHKSKSSHEKSSSSDVKRKVPRKSSEKLSKEKYLRNKLVKKALSSLKSNTAIDAVALKELKVERSKMLNENFDLYLKKAQKSVKMPGLSYSDGTAKDNTETNNKQYYENSLSKSAFTAQERYDVLNARDKLIRLNDTNKDDSEGKKISGTCPDMCPEKERYSRIAKNCLSILETEKALNPSSSSKEVNHQYMVKEYSRSSADQQEPLPHELRPVPVLKLTMDYLICNIIDKPSPHISKADWFDFIWNRTRSIRKDITQQQLCDPDSVEIIEKCVRFHIYCAEALSEEDTATFDPKINNENLTKSLQTLKHMYYDLQTKGIKCRNEAEFRAYDILLSLTEGETLRLVKDIHKDIVKSSDLKFAFNAALAFESNNYVKFFKLFEKASFLNSCILHRYINEARIRGVQTIIKAYSTSNQSISYPLANLVRDLKFENELEAGNFCQWHGLTTDDLFVTIERQTFARPSSAFPIARSPTLVNNKLTSGLGEAINNGPLNENPLAWYNPANSFNDEGLLQDESVSFESNQSFDESIIEDMDQDIVEMKDTNEAFPLGEIPATQNKFKDIKETVEKGKAFSFKTDNQGSSWPLKSTTSIQKQPLTSNLEKYQSINSMAPVVPITSAENFATPKPLWQQPFQKTSSHLKSNAFSFKDSSPLSKPEKSNSHQMFMQRASVTEKSFSNFSKESTSSLQPSQSMHLFNRSDPITSKPRTVGDLFREKFVAMSQIQSTPTMDKPLPKSSSPFPQLKTTSAKPFQQSSSFKPLQHASSIKPLQPTSSNKQFQQTSSTNEMAPITSDSPFTKLIKDNREEIINDEEQVSNDANICLDKNITDDQKTDELELAENSDSYGISSGEDEEVLLELKAETEAALIADVSDEVYTQCIAELSSKISKEIIAEEWNHKRKLDEYLAVKHKHLAMQTIYKWKLYCQRKKQRKIIEDFEPLSPWMPMLINSEYVPSGATSPFTAYQTHCSVSRLADSKIEQQKQKVGWEPLDENSFSHVSKLADYPSTYLKNTGITKFFKLGILYINYGDDKLCSLLEWLSAKLKLTAIPNTCGEKKLLSFYALNVGKTLVHIQCAAFESSSTSELEDFLYGISGVILFCPDKFPNQEQFNTAFQWLHTVFDGKNLPFPFPLFTYFLATSEKYHAVNQVVSFLDDRLHLGQSFSAVKIGEMTSGQSYVQCSNNLVNAIKWLIENAELPPDLVCCSFRDYLEGSYASAFNTLFWKLSLSEFKLLMQAPEEMIAFYNKVMKARGTLLSSEFLTQVSEFWPPKELLMLQPDFKFIDPDFQQKCETFVEDLCLPAFKGDATNTADLWMYLNDITDPSDPNKELLLISVRNLLEKDYNSSWPHIISKCAYYLICNKFSAFSELLDKEVFVMKNDLEAVNFDRYWQLLSISLKKKEQIMKKRKSVQKTCKRVSKMLKSDLVTSGFLTPDVDKRSKISLFSNIADVPDSATCKVNNMLKSLQAALKEQSLESDRFLQKLNESARYDVDGKDNQSDCVIESHSQSPSSHANAFPPVSESNIPCDELNVTSDCDTNLYGSTVYNVTGSWRALVGQAASSFEYATPSNISEKLAELRYNIQRNKLLEDNLSQLLNT